MLLACILWWLPLWPAPSTCARWPLLICQAVQVQPKPVHQLRIAADLQDLKLIYFCVHLSPGMAPGARSRGQQ